MRDRLEADYLAGEGWKWLSDPKQRQPLPTSQKFTDAVALRLLWRRSLFAALAQRDPVRAGVPGRETPGPVLVDW